MSEDWENVILLSVDALRVDHLSCYGYHRETSPVLDELAEESIQFTNAYSASSHTREAVPALLTGKYPDVAINSEYHLATDTIASELSKRGFSTGGFHSNPFVSRAYGFNRGFDVFDDDLHLGQHKLIALAQRALDKFRNRHYARAREINERSLKWVDSLDSEDPFFLWNHYMDTHGPYEPPGEYATLYADHGLSARDAQSLYQRAIADPESITDDERRLLINLYDGEIRYNDEQIGLFLDELKQRGLLEESLVIVTADHGDAFGEHGYYEHPRYLHDEITHVPLLVWLPESKNETVDAPLSTLDIGTMIQSGSSDYLLNELAADRRIFSQVRGEGENCHLRRYAVRTRDNKCFAERDTIAGTIEVTESTDVKLHQELKTHIERRVSVENDGEAENNEDANEEIERRLSALGYKE
ncbi:sulfatase [Haloarcula sediminis]|uniref:sulfatase n=1 Tax=Haloarcula sediminis TaxID=3111777 RepID=UPI002D7A3D35|nr:sulfatase [Haloarcula sp. CK38]